MSPEDRELLLSLRRQQQELQHSLERLQAQLNELEARTEIPPFAAEILPELPPIPLHLVPPPPPVEPFHALPPLPSIFLTPAGTDIPKLPPLPPPPAIPKPSLEFQFGKWLLAIGAVFGILTLAFIFSLPWVQQRLGAAGLLGLSAAVSVGVVVLGERLDRKGGGLRIAGRTIMAMALAWLYLTAYAATNDENLRVIHSPFLGGLLLLLWSVYVLLLAERKKSQTLSLFAISLAYFSSAINPLSGFTMVADLLLAATAVVLLLRNGWAALSYLSLLGTYVVLLRRLVVDESGMVVLDTSRTLSFGPHAVYLIGAWLIFTAAVLLSTAPSFRGGKRLAFLSLNNGGLTVLLVLTAYISGYGYNLMSWSVLATGVLLLVTSRLVGWGRTEVDAREVSGAYLAQGLGLLTAGIMMVYAGVSRGVLLALETLFLGVGGAFSRSLILITAAYFSAFFAMLFLVWEIAVHAHHPWLLGVGSALIMLANAWWARREVRDTAEERQKIVLGSSYYCALALGLIFTAMNTVLSPDMLPPALAFVGVALTLSIYFLPLYELPPIAQSFLVGAQILVLFPADIGESLSQWSIAAVAIATLGIITWWSRQRVTRCGPWMVALNFVYALALVGLTYHAVRPHVDPQGWMVSASLLSVAFLIWGAFTRVWPLAAAGQVFLAVALYHFFVPPGGWDASPFPWSWRAMAVPVTVVFSIGRALHEWLRVFPEITGSCRANLRALAYFYQGLTLALVIRWIIALVPQPDQIFIFLFLGALLLAWNVRRESVFGIRCSFVLSALGFLLYLQGFNDLEYRSMVTFINGLAVILFLCQPGFLSHGSRVFVTTIESWILVLLSVAMGWFFVSAWVWTRIHENYLTMGWALYALFLFFLGLLMSERRMRWCGLAILLAAMVRVFLCDFWGFSNGYRVLTFVVLTVITLGLGFIYARFADRLKTWL